MFPPPSTRSLFCAIALLPAAGGLRARADGVAEVEALRAAYREESVKVTLPLREAYAKALAQLERRMAARGDYENAAKVRAARSGVEPGGAPPSFSPAKPARDGSFSLLPETAETEGGVALHRDSGTLRHWGGAGALARWRLPAGLGAGGYEVEVTFTSSAACSGGLTVRGAFHFLKRDWNSAAEEVSPRTEALGTLRLRANNGSIEFAAEPAGGSDAFQLRSLRITPAAAQS